MADRSRRLTFRLAKKMDEAQKLQGLSFDNALNSVALYAYRAANAHSFYFVLQNNLLALDKYFPDKPELHTALLRLLELLCLSELSERGSDWGNMLEEQTLDAVEGRLPALLLEVRPDAVALSDCF